MVWQYSKKRHARHSSEMQPEREKCAEQNATSALPRKGKACALEKWCAHKQGKIYGMVLAWNLLLSGKGR